jgi:endonuclease/exonuclease/phosphatase family metal-dependent hydrolase
MAKRKKIIRILRITLKTMIICLVVLVLLCAGFLVFSHLRDYRPDPVEELEAVAGQFRSYPIQKEFSLITWNIGYCGLGAEQDFFYDGGKNVRPADDMYQRYINGVYNVLGKYDTVDFVLLQEVDRKSRRSYSLDQVDILRKVLPGHAYIFACNYKVDFVPLPVTNPMGRVESGLVTFGRFLPESSVRYSFPVNFDWPKNLFMPDRCFTVCRYALPGRNDLVVVNVHNSAYDDSGLLRFYERWFLRSFLLSEYEKGNFVIAGGDWNQNPPGDTLMAFKESYLKDRNNNALADDFMPPGWQWCFDPDYPTNRNLNEAYVHGSTPTTILDFFLVSPNLRVMSATVIPDDFEYSDHHPVFLKVRLIEDEIELSTPRIQEMIMLMNDSITKLNEFIDKRFGRPKKPAKAKK